MYDVQQWAEVHHLHHREGRSKTDIARTLGMSRNTVARLLALKEPPHYERPAGPSLLDPFKDAIAAMLDVSPHVSSRVVLERIRRDGYAGGVSILKEHLLEARPQFLAARAYQRTTYLPGEVGQADWWHPIDVPVGRDRARPVSGLVVSLPHSAAHAVVFSFGRTVADVLEGILGCLVRLGGVPDKLVVDNDPSIVATRRGRQVTLHPEVDALAGQLRTKVVVLKPGTPESKGHVERQISFFETSFLPLRRFDGIDDLQGQFDRWTEEVAYRRHHRRVGALVGDALAVERGFLAALPEPLPCTARSIEVRVSKDFFVRVGDVDYSVPPALSGRRVTLAVTAREVVVHHEHTERGRPSPSQLRAGRCGPGARPCPGPPVGEGGQRQAPRQRRRGRCTGAQPLRPARRSDPVTP